MLHTTTPRGCGVHSVSNMPEQGTRFPDTKTRETVHINIYRQTFDFLATAQQCVDLRPKMFICEDTQNPSCIQLQMKMKSRFTNAFLLVSNHSHPTWDFWMGATFHDWECPSERWFRRRTFSAFVVNCDLINNKNSTFIKLKTWTVNYYVNCMSHVE